MTHIIELEQQDYEQTHEEFCALILKPVRTVNIGDKIIFELGTMQQERIVISISDRPGLMKGYALYIFEPLNKQQ